MKIPRTILLLAIAGAGLFQGCGHLNLVPVGEPDRVLVGSIHFSDDVALPADAVVVVRVLDTTRVDMPPQILGEQTIDNPGSPPIPFRVEYTAEDDLLRRGLSIEVRVSYGGRIEYSNANGSLVTFSDVDAPHEIWVQKM
jgi:uncharacterized lipoprotein YbaY